MKFIMTPQAKNLIRLLMIAILGIMTTSCNDDDPAPMSEEKDIVEIVVEGNNFTTLEAAVVEADLVTILEGEGPFTVFAPTDNAFNLFFNENGLSAEELLASPDLSGVLTYHVLDGEVMASNVNPGEGVTVNGASFYLSEDVDGNFWINGSAQIVDTDIDASNGVIHVLDYVIVPPSESIAEIAVSFTNQNNPEFTQLVGALQRADLVGALSDDNGDLTVFAPTDAAFQALYDTNEDWDDFNDIPLETLEAVLLAHVVPVRAFSQDLRQGQEIATLNENAMLTVDLSAGTVGGAALNTSLMNVHATNGVIHVINDVILP
ncbi:fasciclin domain-containing protein [Echinicola jeungdonensis]|uniref:Fasciclin domain-containing protein n=1 Tax=Echinicola jeungdonensis TaxID=709343 RepID=A0ABV5J6U3_9BACT|nr:fasciclin domain-containing protein [Echinicola jeungdonensis]MDN3669799.1 fasciclin domain-containing protein [Echinicola jeungdonensis]